MTPAEQAKYIAKLEAEKAALEAELAKKNTFGALRCKVTVARAAGSFDDKDKGSEGGAVSVYNLQRMPITLYKEQWARLIGKFEDSTDLGFIPELKKFLRDNDKLLKTKPVKTAVAA